MSEKNYKLKTGSIVLMLFGFLFVNGNVFEERYNEEAGKIYLKKINADIQVKTTESVLASWAYESNITDENLRHQLEVSAKLANYTKEIWKETIKFPWTTFKDPDIKRQFQKFSVLGTAILPSTKYKKFNKIVSDMQSIYGKAKICNYYNRTDCSMQLEPEITEVFAKSRNPDELRYYWEEWRNAAGKPVRAMFKEYVDLSNEAAVLNNFTNNAEFWVKDYEAKDFKEQVEELWEQLKPLYLQLHAYVRRRLREQYGEKYVTKRGPIPAHLLGNMWAQSWGNIFDFTAPYPGKPSMNVTPNMVKQNYTPLRMFKLAEEFFTSLNLSPMPETFWKNSILEKPKDGRDLICHASAWDFYDGKDFRIKQCTRITFRQLVTVHHEMGHVQYYLQYKNQPKIFKRGANPGFHEAVGDVMALSVSTPKHLRKIGLLNSTEDDAESDINQLFNMALDKIAFLPFGYLMDQWRWSVFEGKTTEDNYNCKWWQLREKYQGLSPSTVRTEEDFDPGAKYHTVGNVPYIRYFVSFVIQFQFHRSLCIAAKEFDPSKPESKPLHKCDIYQSKEAGELLKKMLQMGSSKPWPDAMEVMTGQRKMDASALLDYFSTLKVWLENENRKTNEFIGWDVSQRECEWAGKTDDGDVLSSSEGIFESDNIAYSYAELVRQDENSFGVPDYIEEVKPVYHALLHRLKKKELNKNYFLPTKRTVRLSKKKEMNLPNLPYFQNYNYIIGVSNFQIGQKSLKNKLKRKSANQKYTDNVLYQAFKFPTDKKLYKEPFQVCSKSADEERTKILNRIIQDQLRVNNGMSNKQCGHKRVKKFISGRKISKTENYERSLGNKKIIKSENSVENQGEVVDQIENKISESDEKISLEEDQRKSSLLALNQKKSNINYKNKVTEGEEITDNQVYNTNILNLRKSTRGQKIAEASDILKGSQTSKLRPETATLTSSIRIRKKTRRKRSELNSEKLNKNWLKIVKKNSIKSNSFGQRHENDAHVNNLVKLTMPARLTCGKECKKRRNDENENNIEQKNKYTYEIVLRKPADVNNDFINNNLKKNLKKSYKEYHYNIRTPISYNAVVIASGKNEKPDETRDRWYEINDRIIGHLDEKKSMGALGVCK